MTENRAELSPTALDESDSGAISPPWEEEPAPGLNGAPVRCTLFSVPIFVNWWQDIICIDTGYDVRSLLYYLLPEWKGFVLRIMANFTVLQLEGGPHRTLYSDCSIRRETWYKCWVRFSWFNSDYIHSKPFRFLFKPLTLTALALGMSVLAYVATTNDVLEEGKDKRRLFAFYLKSLFAYFWWTLRGVYASIAFFLLFSMIQFRDGPFVRPHPAFWRIVLGINLLYELALVFLLFQDLRTARDMMTYLDPSLGRPLPEKSYAEDCSFTPRNIWVWFSRS